MSLSNIKTFGSSLNSIFTKDSAGHVPPENLSIIHLSIKDIKPRINQPRKFFEENAHNELVASIREKGVIQPIIVRLSKDKYYEIVVGERRWRAAEAAGLTTIPVIIKDYSQQDIMIIALMENIHRQDLGVIEEALAVQALILEFSLTHEQVAKKLGKARTTITNLLRLLDLEEEVKFMLEQSLIEVGHAKVLLSLKGETQLRIANLIIKRQLSVRKTEELVKNFNEKDIEINNVPNYFSDEQLLKGWKNSLFEKLNSKVNIQVNKNGQGRITIEFNDINTLSNFVNKVSLQG